MPQMMGLVLAKCSMRFASFWCECLSHMRPKHKVFNGLKVHAKKNALGPQMDHAHTFTRWMNYELTKSDAPAYTGPFLTAMQYSGY